MANPTDRQSLTLNMEDRYNKSKAGGAFDAKSAGKTFTDGIPNDFADGFTKGGLKTRLPKKDSMFLTGHNTKKYEAGEPKKDSMFLKGHNTQKYKG